MKVSEEHVIGMENTVVVMSIVCRDCPFDAGTALTDIGACFNISNRFIINIIGLMNNIHTSNHFLHLGVCELLFL
jgi:hypothetical protein